MKKRGRGAIVFAEIFVSFRNGGTPGIWAYAASKAGLIRFVQSLASAHAADEIRVNAVLPDGTKTEMAGDAPETHAFIAGLHPMKRMADPMELAQSALSLLSDRARFGAGARSLWAVEVTRLSNLLIGFCGQRTARSRVLFQQRGGV